MQARAGSACLCIRPITRRRRGNGVQSLRCAYLYDEAR